MSQGLDDRTSFYRLIEGLRQAESASKELAFMREQPQWLLIQRGLEAMRDKVTALASARTH